MTIATPVVPQWIAKMYPGKTGRDHLGLGSVSSDQILPTLSPGIVVLTIHPRYHTFYTFLLDEFWRRGRPGSRSAWRDFFRPREFIFSVGANLCDRPEHGLHGRMRNVVGSSVTQPLAARRLPAYDTSTPYIDSELGGYGLYYRMVMMNLGFILPGGSGYGTPIDVPTEKGREAAEMFRSAVRDTEYYRTYFDQDRAQVPLPVIEEYIRKACLCQSQREDAPDHALLLDAFLHEGGAENAAARRLTFRLLLDMARQTDGYMIDQDAFRHLIYFGSTPDGAAYVPPDDLLDAYRRWRLYQAREYYSYALNALWLYLCSWGLLQHGDLRPTPFDQLWAHVHEALDFDALAACLSLPGAGLNAASDVQSLLDCAACVNGTTTAAFDSTCALSSPLNEHVLYTLARANPNDPVAMLAGAATQLALIYLRFGHRDLRMRPDWEIARMGAEGRLSIDGFVRALEQRLAAGPYALGAFARWLLEDYVITQHQLVAAGKLPDNTYRFQREGGRLQFFPRNNVIGFMDSRYDALSTTVYELGLCGNLLTSHHPLTPAGERLLRDGDLP